MAIIRLSSGSDIKIHLSVKEALELFSTLTQTSGFVEVEGEEGMVYVRQNDVIAIFPEPAKRGAGFQLAETAKSKR